MRLVLLLLALLVCFGLTCRQTAKDMKRIVIEKELKEYQKLPNVLPVVEVVAERS